MRLAIINDEIDQDLDRAAAAAADQGFQGLEIRSAWNTPPHLLSDERLRTVRATTEAHGLRIAGFCPPALKCALPRTAAEVDAVRGLLVDSLRRARLLGAPFVRIFTFFRENDPDPRAAATAARAVLDGVTWSDTEVVIETGTRTNSPTMRHTMEFLDALGDDRLGVLWDPGNSVFSGWDAEPFPRDYALGRERIRHVHVKDPDGTNGYVGLGDGDLPWTDIIETLRTDGYTGWLSLETHWRIGRVLTGPQRDEPWGDEFSADGYQASLTCMRRLRELLDGRRGADRREPVGDAA